MSEQLGIQTIGADRFYIATASKIAAIEATLRGDDGEPEEESFATLADLANDGLSAAEYVTIRADDRANGLSVRILLGKAGDPKQVGCGYAQIGFNVAAIWPALDAAQKEASERNEKRLREVLAAVKVVEQALRG